MTDDNILPPIYALDPGLVNRAIEQQLGQRIFGALGSYDNELGQRLIEIAHGSEIFGPASILDPELARRQINAALFEGGGTYVASAVHFDGNTWLRNGSLVATDGNLFSCSFWFRNSDPSTFNMDCGVMFVVDPENNYTTLFDFTGVVPTTTMDIQIGLLNAAGNKGVSTADINNPTPNADLAWHHVLFSGQSGQSGGSNACKLYLDNFDVTNAVSDQGPFALAFNGLSFWVGADNFGGGPGSGIIGDIADVWIAPNVSLLTDGDIPPATRALFIDQTTSKPVNPSDFPASAILFSGDASSFGTNQGTGGTFTFAAGALTDAGTHP